MEERLQGWLDFLVGLKNEGVQFSLQIDLGEEFGEVYVEIPDDGGSSGGSGGSGGSGDGGSGIPVTRQRYIVDTTGKNNNKVKVRPLPSNSYGEHDFVLNGEIIEGPKGKVQDAFIFIDDRVNPNTHLVAGWVEAQYLRIYNE